MIRIIHAELVRLLRRRTLVGMAAGALAFALVAGFTVFASAADTTDASRRGGATLADLTSAGGGTAAFATAASFAGFLVFVTVIALVATDFSGGTLRAMLLRDPHRVRMIVGKLAGFLIVAASVVLVAEVSTLAVSWLVAPTQDISSSAWFSLEGLGAAATDYSTVLAGVAGWAVFGTTLGVIFRSTPLALGVGFAWAGPVENIIVESWPTGFRFFPGQVLGSLIRGGTIELGFGRAVVTALAYTAVAFTATLLLMSRRDVTS